MDLRSKSFRERHRCPGRVLKGTPIAVDIWKRSLHPEVKLWFLTHCHTDHTVGLGPSWPYMIYCSQVTAKLLPTITAVDQSVIVALELHQVHILALDEGGQVSVQVTLIDANHCAGAVMFLFEGYFGRVLFTGDFRYDADLHLPLIQPHNRIHCLFLDSTYWTCKNLHIISCDEAVNQICRIIRRHADKYILIGVNNLGKDELLVKVAQELEEKVYVFPKKFKLMQLLAQHDSISVDEYVTDDPTISRLHCVSMQSLHKEFQIYMSKYGGQVILIVPSCIHISGLAANYNQNQFDRNKSFFVEYSNHSSHSELVQFLTNMQPGAIVDLQQPVGLLFEEMAKFVVEIPENKVDNLAVNESFSAAVHPKRVRNHLRDIQKLNRRRSSSTTAAGLLSSSLNKGVLFCTPKKDSTGNNAVTTSNSSGSSDCDQDKSIVQHIDEEEESIDSIVEEGEEGSIVAEEDKVVVIEEKESSSSQDLQTVKRRRLQIAGDDDAYLSSKNVENQKQMLDNNGVGSVDADERKNNILLFQSLTNSKKYSGVITDAYKKILMGLLCKKPE